MPTHAAFLRAINLGGHRRALRAELLAALEDAGFYEVNTFRASGNVVLGARGGERRIVRAIQAALAGRLGFPVDVYLRSFEELRRLIAAAEALPQPGGRLQVAFLSSRPSAAVQEEVLAHASEADLLSFGERELLWLRRPPGAHSDLNLRAIERLTGPWTMRTIDTVSGLVTRYFT
jgi:uncharacterized protein (DUF1697 family)